MAAPEIRLSVGLDLEFFRGQMRKAVNIAQSEFNANLKVTIDRKKISAELKNLERAIKRGTYRIEIGGNLDKVPDKITNLKKALSGLDGTKIEISVGGVASINAKESRKIRTALRASIMGEGGKILVPASIVPAITNADVATFKKVVAEKLSGIKVEVGVQAGKFSSTSTGAAGLHEYMRSQGMSGGNMPGAASVGRSERLRKALEEQTVKQLNELAKGQGLSGYSKLNKDPLINKLIAELGNDAAEALLGNIKMQMGNAGKSPIKRSFLDQIARAVFFMAGVDPSQLQAQQQKTLSKQRPPIGPSSTGRLLSAAAGPAGLISGNTGPFGFLPRTTAKGSLQDAMRMLPEKQAFAGGPGALALSAEKLKSRVDAILREYFRTIAVQVSEAFDSPAQLKKQLNVFSYLVQSLKDAERRTKENKVKEAVASLVSALEAMAKNAAIEVARIKELPQRPAQPMLRAQRIAGLLSPVSTGRYSGSGARNDGQKGYREGLKFESREAESRSQMMARRTAEAYVRSALRSMDVMGGGAGRTASPYSYAYRNARPQGAIVPYTNPGNGAIVPTEPRARGGTAAPAGRTGGIGTGGLNIPNLPGTGLVQELGTEFAFAAKQVLLFGTAYKALAFLTGFPQQVGDAVGALQTFRNTLNAISPSAGEAAASSQFILDIVDKYNVPLQSARDGFTKLYASMQPAGFSGNEIRDLFLGISQSAATFGMSADKVDRVNYAFAQMASKGQVMSEELKGQLGDVLPGAMAIFAEAAGFKGPEAIKTFSKALEDGAYKGGAMKALLLNVGTIMRKEFGPGAEGAARTFQGSINRMQNSLKLLYESFEPVAIGFLNSVVMPMTAGLKTVTQGVTAYFKGQRAATPEAENFNKILQVLAPSLAGIGKNIAYALQQLLPLVQVVSAVALQVARFLALPLVGYLAGTYLQVMLLTSGFSLLATSGIALATASMVRFVAQGVVAASVMLGLQRATQQTTVATFLFGQTLQAVMIKSVIGIALVAISTLIAKIMELRGQLAAVGGDAKGMEDIAKSSAKMGDVEGTKEALGNIKDRLATFKKLQKELRDAKKTSAGGSAFSDRATINTGYEIGSDTARKLIELGVLNEKVLTKTSNGYSLLESQMGIVNSLVNKNVAEFEKAGQKGNILTDEAIRKNEQLKKQTGLLPIPPGGEGKKPESLETYYSLQDQLAKAASAADIARIQDEFEERFRLANSYYDLQEARANSFQKITINFQKELLAIEQRRQKAMLDAELDVRKARESVASEATVGGGAISSTAGVSGLTEYLTGDPSSSGYRADHATIQQYHDHLAFATREAAVNAYKKMVEAGIKVTEFKGYGAGVTGPHSGPGSLHHAGLAMDVPGYQWGGSGAIGAKEYAGSARVRAVMGIGGGVTAGAAAPGKILGSERRQTLATQQTGFAVQNQNIVNLRKEQVAANETAVAIANYVAAHIPVAEQRLQNQLLQQRITLTQNSFSPEILDAQLAYGQQELQTAISIKDNVKEIERLTAAGGDNANQINALRIANSELGASLPVSAIQILTKSIDTQVLSIIERTKATKQDAVDQEKISSLIIGGMTRQAAEGKVAAENLRNNYSKALEEATKQVEIAAAAEEVLAAARRLGKKETEEQTRQYNALADALKKARDYKAELEGKAPQVGQAATAAGEPAKPKTPGAYIADGLTAAQEKLQELTNIGYQTVQAANAIGEAFGSAFKNVISGSMTAQEALASFFQSVGESFADMVAQMIAEYLKMALIKGIMSLIPGVGTIAGAAAGGFSSGAAGFGGGFDSGIAALPGIPDFSGAFKTAANGAVWTGGFQAFADGGIVKGPTLGLVGEGRYNEAVVPLPDGKSIPVDLSGMGGGAGSISTNIVINVSNGQAQSNTSGGASDLGRKMEGAVKQVIVNELRPGGLLGGGRR